MTEPVVPIREGVRVEGERALALLEHVAHCLAAFPDSHAGEEPLSIAFVIVGKDGSIDSHWLTEGPWRPVVATAAATLLFDAGSPDSDQRSQRHGPPDTDPDDAG